MKRTVFTVAGILVSVLAAAAAYGQPVQTLVDTGHKGAVLAIEYDSERDLVVTAGEDGTVRLWDASSRSLRSVLQAGHLEAAMVAVNPASSRIAVLETDGTRSFTLSEWDWETGLVVFRRPLAEQPLFLRYSGAGSYLLYGTSGWDGLRILDAADGSVVAFHPEGFGIVSFAEMSRNEKTIMTYQPKGRIAYWDLATGDIIKDIAQAVPHLSALSITQDRRFLLGSDGNEILLVDLLSGSVRSRASLPGVMSSDISGDGQFAACVADGSPSGSLSFWSLRGDTLSRSADPPTRVPNLVLARYAGNTLYCATRDGSVYALEPGGDVEAVFKDMLAEVTGIAAAPDLLSAASARWIWTFRSDTAGVLEPAVRSNPLGAPSGLAYLPDGRLVDWSRSNDVGAYGILDRQAGVFKPGFAGFTSPLMQALPQGGRLLTLEKGGMARIINPDSGASDFELWSPGMNRLALVSPQVLVGGRTAGAGVGEGSLLSINIATGETVSIPGASIFTYEILFDPNRGFLYSLGVDEKGETGLFVNKGAGFDTGSLIESFPGEDLNASLALDPATGILYASLGYDRVATWDGKALGGLPATGHIPRKLAVQDGRLYSLNKDSSVTIWDLATADVLCEVYLFTDSGWCVIFPDGRFASSAGKTRLVNVYEDGSLTEDKESHRVTLGER